MALTNIVKTLVLDVYDHDQTQAVIKAIALDSKTRYVQATLTYMGADYPVSETATVTLTVLRPDKVGAQVVGSVVDVDNADRTGTIKGVFAELTQAALAVRGKCLCQFKITDGEQILRTEIFAVNNGQALDADITDWAGVVDGHNLDEMADSIEALETSVGTLQTDVTGLQECYSEYTTPITTWVQGTIGASNGLNSDSNTRCRANGYFTNHDLGFGTVKITIATGLRLAARVWDSEMKYVGAYPSDWVSGELEMPVQAGYSYRFVVSKSNNGAITPSDIPADGIQIVVSGYTDDKVRTTGKPADALAARSEIKAYNSPYNGRTSTILAAKTFSHKDGTHPTIDWYLLCDYAGDMYISKDLKSRTYITKKIDWNQYKYAVRANGDIIAVYRTEFITGGTQEYGPSLDSQRQNPLVCLASEGYATWHEVDFGVSKKPCGWVENVGACLLPNGDLLFAEYTRMLVMYTANLWRIKAGVDVTDPTNWEILKTFTVAEDDDTEYDETVIEHFHCVQVDPYTGTVYFTTGDKGNKSQIWYSTDNGTSWTKQTLDGQTSGEELFRLVNFSFAPNKVYWASDDPENHVVISCERGASGLNPNSVQILTTMPLITGRPATYGQVLYEDLGLIVMLDRLDGNASEMPFRAYDLVDGTVKTICTVKSATGADVHVGFRTEYTEFDPEDGVIKMGFGNNSNYLNRNAICGNPAKTFAENVNNLSVRISMDADRNVYARFGTYYI